MAEHGYQHLDQKFNLPKPNDQSKIHIHTSGGYTVILPDRTLKNGASLILHSSIARNSSAPNAKIIFEILKGHPKGQLISE